MTKLSHSPENAARGDLRQWLLAWPETCYLRSDADWPSGQMAGCQSKLPDLVSWHNLISEQDNKQWGNIVIGRGKALNWESEFCLLDHFIWFYPLSTFQNKVLIKLYVHTFLILCHRSLWKNAGSLNLNVWHLWDGIPASSVGETVPTFRHVGLLAPYHGISPKMSVSTLFRLAACLWMASTTGIGTDQQNNWAHSWDSSIYPVRPVHI